MAMIYTRIANPYMPNGTAAATNTPTLYAPGELGGAFSDQNTGRNYVRVKLDSGATSATPTGAVAANQLAFWKDRANFVVTNDKRMAGDANVTNGAINNIAGIFQNATTAGYYTDIVIAGRSVSVAGDNSGSIGFQAVADTTAAVARVVSLAAANTAPVSQVVGRISGTPSGGVTPVDVLLGFIG